MNRNLQMIFISAIAALYTVLTLILQPISFGPLQFRLSELLCLFAIDFPFVIPGLVIGTFVSNLFFGGLGIADAVFGSIATLLACLMSNQLKNRRIKNLPIASFFCFVIINAFFIGIELGILTNNSTIIPLSILEVGISETLVLFIIGLPLYPRMKEIFLRIFSKSSNE